MIVIGGDLLGAHEQLLAGAREMIFEHSLPLATHELRTVPSQLGEQAGIVGAAVMVADRVLAPQAESTGPSVPRWREDTGPRSPDVCRAERHRGQDSGIPPVTPITSPLM